MSLATNSLKYFPTRHYPTALCVYICFEMYVEIYFFTKTKGAHENVGPRAVVGPFRGWSVVALPTPLFAWLLCPHHVFPGLVRQTVEICVYIFSLPQIKPLELIRLTLCDIISCDQYTTGQSYTHSSNNLSKQYLCILL